MLATRKKTEARKRSCWFHPMDPDTTGRDLAYLSTAGVLFRRVATDCLFVPIRNMQYLAVVDEDEVIFSDGAGDRSIEMAWQNFRPQARSALTDSVPYEAVYYATGAPRTMIRLQS